MKVLAFIAGTVALGSATLLCAAPMPQDTAVINLDAGATFTGGITVDRDTTIHGGGDEKSNNLPTIRLAEGESIRVLPHARLTLDNVNIDLTGQKTTAIDVGANATGDFDHVTITGGNFAFHYGLGSTGHLDHITAMGQQESIQHEGNGSLFITNSRITSASSAGIHVAYNDASTTMTLSLDAVDLSGGDYGLLAGGATAADITDSTFISSGQAINGPVILDAAYVLFADNADYHVNLMAKDGFRPDAALSNCRILGGTNGVFVDNGFGHLRSCVIEGMTNGISVVNGAGSEADPFTIADVTMTDITQNGVFAGGGGYVKMETGLYERNLNSLVFEDSIHATVTGTEVDAISSSAQLVVLGEAVTALFDKVNFSGSSGRIGVVGNDDVTISNSQLKSVTTAVSGNSSFVAKNNIMHDSQIYVTGDAAIGMPNCNIEDNFMQTGYIALSGVGRNVVRRNWLNVAAVGISCNGTGPDSIIDSNYFETSLDEAIYMKGCTGTKILGNTIDRSGVSYLNPPGYTLIIDTCSDISIERNCFEGNERYASVTNSTVSQAFNFYSENYDGDISSQRSRDIVHGCAFVNHISYTAVRLDHPVAAAIDHNLFGNGTRAGAAISTAQSAGALPIGAPNNYWNSPDGPKYLNNPAISPATALESISGVSPVPFLTAPGMDVFHTVFYNAPVIYTNGGGARAWVSMLIPPSNPGLPGFYSNFLNILRPSFSDSEPAPSGTADPRPMYIWVPRSLNDTPRQPIEFRFAMDGPTTQTTSLARYNRETGAFDTRLAVSPDPSNPLIWRVRADANLFTTGTWYFVGGAAQPASVDAAMLSMGGDFWISEGDGNGALADPVRNKTIGLQFDEHAKIQAVPADINGDGLTDIATIDGQNRLSLSLNLTETHFNTTKATVEGAGWRYDPEKGYRVFPGDFNGDHKTDLLQTTEYGDRVWVGLSNGSRVTSPPVEAGAAGFRYSPLDGQWLGVGDVDGDGADDLIQCTPYRDAWVALSTSDGKFAVPTNWGVTGFQWSLTDHFGIHAGDFTGDGRCDILQVTPYGDVWVAASTGTSFANPVRWGWIGYKDGYATYDGDDPACFAADVNGDGKMDLLYLNEFGEIWTALSTGASFQDPVKTARPGFRHNDYLGRYQTFFGNFGPPNTDAAPAKTLMTILTRQLKPALPFFNPRGLILPTPTPSLTPTPGISGMGGLQ